MEYLKIHNWEKHQIYKDREPKWIKVYRELAENYEYSKLPDNTKAHLIGIWLLAARTENKIPKDPNWIQSRISANTPVDLDLLVESGFLEVCTNLYESVQNCTEDETCLYESVQNSDHVCKKSYTDKIREEKIRVEESILLCPEKAETALPSCAFPSEPETTPTKNQPDEFFEKETPALSFPCDGGGFYELSSHQIEQYQSAYPTIQVDSTLEQALYWILANPRRRKTKAGYPRFIIGWLNTAQNGFRNDKIKQKTTSHSSFTQEPTTTDEVPF